MSKKLDPTCPVPFPAPIIIDTREQSPFTFTGLYADARDGGGPLIVETARGTLQSGDYSVAGIEEVVAVERKSLADLFSTIGQGRDRFVRELSRLNDLRVAAVVVEADWRAILHDPPAHTQLTPKTVFRSIVAWQQRFQRVHWWFCSDRRLAEVTTLRILERAWKDVRSLHGMHGIGVVDRLDALPPGSPEAQDAGVGVQTGVQAVALELLAANARLRLESRPSDRRVIQSQFNDLAVALAKASLRASTASACAVDLVDGFEEVETKEKAG